MQINIYIQPVGLVPKQKTTPSPKPVFTSKKKPLKKSTIYQTQPINTLSLIGTESDLTPETDEVYLI